MTQMLKVRNWEQFQHYKERNPPWIKLHFALLSSEDWVSLDDASRVLAIACMLVASRNKGEVPNNPAYMQRVAYLNTLPDFRPLISCGFFEKPLSDASTIQADARPEERQSREESMSETRVSDPSPKKPPQTKRRVSYPEPFEVVWRDYPTDANMSKKEAFDAFKRLDEADVAALAASIPAFKAYCRANPDYRPIHLCRFIKFRRFEGFAANGHASLPDSERPPEEMAKIWRGRIEYGRVNHKWVASKWGPPPGADGCLVPAEMLQPGDGQGWIEYEHGRAA